MMNSKTTSSAQKNWYVVTGGPSTGKTTVIDLLQKKDMILQ